MSCRCFFWRVLAEFERSSAGGIKHSECAQLQCQKFGPRPIELINRFRL
jgi:hypothetical protein